VVDVGCALPGLTPIEDWAAIKVLSPGPPHLVCIVPIEELKGAAYSPPYPVPFGKQVGC